MNDKELSELQFWQDLSRQHDDYIGFRSSEYPDKTKYFPDFEKQEGLGLDYGCGLVSIFEGHDKNVIAIDPLMIEYDKVIPVSKLKLPHLVPMEFPDNDFDWAFCVNVIDHTPDPALLVREIYRLLKPGGKLYFEVNLETVLHAPHYSLWTPEITNSCFKEFKLLSDKTVEVPEHAYRQTWRVYEK